MSDLGATFLNANRRAISKTGTSEGAFLGWETRRGGPRVAPIAEAKQRIGRMVEEAAEQFKREVALHDINKPSDYAGMTRRDRENRAEGLGLVRAAVERLRALEVAEADKETLSRMIDYAEREAPVISERDKGDRMWHEEFSAFLAEAEDVAARAKGPEGMEKGEVVYWQPRDERGRFSHGEARDPVERRAKVESAAREAVRRVIDALGRDANRVIYDTVSEFGLSGNDAAEAFQMVDQRLRKERELEALRKSTEDLLAKAGTSEGARKGWETRRAGAAATQEHEAKETGLEEASKAFRRSPEIEAARERARNLSTSSVPARSIVDEATKIHGRAREAVGRMMEHVKGSKAAEANVRHAQEALDNGGRLLDNARSSADWGSRSIIGANSDAAIGDATSALLYMEQAIADARDERESR